MLFVFEKHKIKARVISLLLAVTVTLFALLCAYTDTQKNVDANKDSQAVLTASFTHFGKVDVRSQAEVVTNGNGAVVRQQFCKRNLLKVLGIGPQLNAYLDVPSTDTNKDAYIPSDEICVCQKIIVIYIHKTDGEKA